MRFENKRVVLTKMNDDVRAFQRQVLLAILADGGFSASARAVHMRADSSELGGVEFAEAAMELLFEGVNGVVQAAIDRNIL